jgi:hypothetical protein
MTFFAHGDCPMMHTAQDWSDSSSRVDGPVAVDCRNHASAASSDVSIVASRPQANTTVSSSPSRFVQLDRLAKRSRTRFARQL